MSKSKGMAIRILGTIMVTGLIWWSLMNPEQGILRELGLLGPLGTWITVAVFLSLVVAYARDLQLLLRALPEDARVARPASVWWMLVIPYNFTEDFFIIENVAASLERAEAGRSAVGAGADRFGRWSGFGWCSLQILSLVPHPAGVVAGMLALPLWLWHWRFVRKARRALWQAD